MNPVAYQYNAKLGLPTDRTYYGIIAQELREVAPYMVSEKDFGAEGTCLTHDGTALTYMLVNAIQEQQQIIESQEARLTELEAQVSRLAAMM